MLHIYRYTLTILLFFVSLTCLQAQETLPLDVLCLMPGGPGFNIVTDDFPAGGEYFVQLEQGSGCFRLDERGLLTIPEDVSASRCCGFQDTLFAFITFPGSDGTSQTFRQFIDLTIKCPKPDCSLVDLDEIPQPDPTQNPDIPQDIPCISACENSTATYLFSENMALTYVWQATNGTVDELPGLPGQIQVSWGPLGPASLSVEIFDASGNLLTTRSYCVTLTEAPIADFTASSVACLDQDVYFTNTSSGAAATYDWDFGDGNTAHTAAPTTVTNAYDTPGTYTVTLVATSNGGLNPDGSEACCCVDSISYDIVIDPDPGPGIFWISTLCEGDTTKYWTDATGCTDILWEISPNGDITTDPTQGTIMVVWNNGPSGTLELTVDGCDESYCPSPSVAVVPIISSSGDITGPTEVCGGETANYALPKWLTTEYTWILPDGGSFNGPNSGHTTSITWPTTPGTYQIVVEYGSSFLAGLPGHEGDDCYGRAVLEVTVLNNFTISATPNPACVDGSTFFNAFTDGAATLYNWSVVGFPGLDVSGQPNFNVDWFHPDLSGPGVYTIVAEVVNPADYCVAVRSITVVVKDAVDPVIVGPLDYCPGVPVVYSILSPTPGYTYTWSIPPGEGMVSTGQGGPTATIIFTSSSTTLSVVGQDSQAPNCVSATVSVNVEEIELEGPITITGPPACTNSMADYTVNPGQHPSATYHWLVEPMSAGSVVAGGDTPDATIQWNDTPGPVTIKVGISICGATDTFELDLDLNAPIEPVITQLGDLCPGGSAMLVIDSTQFDSILWDLGGNAGAVWGPNAGIITIFEEGNYVVHTFDVNGCPGVARIRVTDVPGPDVSITTDSVRQICVNSMPFPGNPVLEADTDAGNTIEWFCGGVSQGPAAIGNTTFTHVWTTTPGTFTYFARVEDPATGCTEDSKPLYIRQRVCCDTPYVSDPISQIHTFEATRQSPNCDFVDLVATFSQDSVVGHGFNWFFDDAQIISVGGTDGVDSMTIRLPGVGCYDINHTIDVWAYEYDTTFTVGPSGEPVIDEIIKVDSIRCGETLTRTVCNPLFADFDKDEECGVVTFTDESDFDLPVPAPTITYSWDFGDGGTSSDINPVHEYTMNGTYTVTLTITDGDCVSTSTMEVQVTDLPDSDFTVSPSPVCYGQPATFTGTGTNVIEWEWDFDDGATFNGNGPQHTFLPPPGVDDYDVTLITTNRAGCMDTIVQTIDIFPTPARDTIEASNGFIICDGASTVLSVDNIPGLDYEWSTGATTSSITVSTAGTYGVTITNADDCSQIIDPVEVQVIPLPDASWIGNPFICDNGSTKLTALAGGGHSFKWENQTTGQVVNAMMYNVPFSSGNTFQDILLTVTNDAYGCTAEVLITVEQAASPVPDAQITAGGDCEGDGTLIEVINPEPDVTYTWNTGEEGLSIFTYAAGTYTVVATDVRTGCVGTDQVTVHPLPDICMVPTGCYEICAPYTLYAPIGDYSYAWYMDGALTGIEDSLVITQAGAYNVTVMDNVTGCASTSELLYLEIIDCDSSDCADIVTSLRPSDEETDIGDCCYEIYYDGLPDNVLYIQVSSPDADLPLVPGSENPVFGRAINDNANSFQLAVDFGATIPVPSSMTTTPAVTFCPIDATTSPQQIIVDYYGANQQVICSDTLYTECVIEPDCVYITTDSLYCADDGTLVFDFTICNPSDADFSVGYVQIIPGSLAAMAAGLPPGFDLFPALAPGDCRTISTSLLALTPGETFSYTIVGHSTNPATDPSALCCSDPVFSFSELIVPDCDPCDNVGVRAVRPQEDGCCYDIFLFNSAPAPFTFDGVDLCLLSGSGTLVTYSSIGDPLVGTVGPGGQTVSVVTADGSDLPGGIFALPTICLEGSENFINEIEIKWLSDGGVVCRDTIQVKCTPPCGYLQEIAVDCKNDVYVWTGTITNTSPFPMSEAYIDFEDSLGLDAYNTTIVFGSVLNPGDSEVITIIIGSPAGPGDKVSFTVTLHETGSDDHHLNCCQFEACIELPDCRIEECSCENEDEFVADVNMGFDTIAQPGGDPLAYLFDPRADFTGCDSIVWSVRPRNPNGPWEEIGTNQVQPYTFPAVGRYQIWMQVYRFDENGKLCASRNAFLTINLGNGTTVPGVGNGTIGAELFDVEVFPNPAEEVIQVALPGNTTNGNKVNISLYDFQGRITGTYSWDNIAPGDQQVFRIPVGDLPAGVYVLRGTDAEGQRWNRRFVKR